MRPQKFDSGFYAIPLTHPLHSQISEELATSGEFYFKSGREVMDAFGLALERSESIQAINAFLSFTKSLAALECRMKNVGFRWLDQAQGHMALTYTIESTKHQNDSMWINEGFPLQVPTKALVNHFARFWLDTEDNRRKDDFLASLNAVASGQ